MEKIDILKLPEKITTENFEQQINNIAVAAGLNYVRSIVSNAEGKIMTFSDADLLGKKNKDKEYACLLLNIFFQPDGGFKSAQIIGFGGKETLNTISSNLIPFLEGNSFIFQKN